MGANIYQIGDTTYFVIADIVGKEMWSDIEPQSAYEFESSSLLSVNTDQFATWKTGIPIANV